MSQLSSFFSAPWSLSDVNITTQKVKVNWERIGSLADLASERFLALGESVTRGCWFLTPAHTVHASIATAAFFLAALKARREWLYQARQVLGNSGLHAQGTSAVSRGQEIALKILLEARSQTEPMIDGKNCCSLAHLNEEERQEVVWRGRLEKQFSVSGVMIIDGELIPPRTWQAQADQLIEPELSEVEVTRRKVNLAAYRVSRDPAPLRTMAINELQTQLALNPAGPLYVNPAITVTAPNVSPTFLERAHAAENEWHGRCYKSLRRDKKTLARAADLPTRLFVQNGVLIIDDQAYLPGCWPDQSPTATKLRLSPTRQRTVPLDFLGLKKCDHSNALA